ncbi:MAG: amidohydrolase family protein [Actinobacteria bacterium]|nr:amidohydrolase family protein [Actinomycetota bacterium]MCG2803801.1 amidohydrolase family protein [Cellulomonas sp.]
MRPALLPSVPVAAGTTLVTGGTVLDGTGAEPREGWDVEVTDGVVSYVGPPRPAAARADRVVDAAGRHVLPGFVDVHVHLTMPNGRRVAQQRAAFAEEHAFDTAESLRLTLEAGVTTVRDLGGLTPGYRTAIAKGQIAGPRAHLAIALLSPTGGHADPVLPNGTREASSTWEQVASWAVVDCDEDVLRAVRGLVRTGADVIKVCTTGGISTLADSPEDLGLSEHEVRLIVSELARRGGRPVAAHAQGAAGALEAVRGGATSLEHGYEMPDELVEAMLARGTVLVPTLSTLAMAPDPAVTPAAVVAKKREWQVRGRDAARRAIAAGVPVALGTDAGIHPHGSNLAELGRLVDAGLDPRAAVRAATLGGAHVLGLADRLGSLEVGKVGDVVVLDVDPLAAPHALADATHVRVVLQSGRVVTSRDGR